MVARFLVREASTIGPGITRLTVAAPRVADRARPGQFVIVRATTDGERIPLTICDQDPEDGSIVLIIQDVGRTSHEINQMRAGDQFADVLGPLGHATEVEGLGRCVVVAGGVGTAIALPVARAMREAGNDVTAVIGYRSAEHVVLIDEMRDAAGDVVLLTEDGSLGEQGLVTNALGRLLDSEDVDHVFTVGPIPMMAAVTGMTRERSVPTVASLNPIMVDGTGMCGGCRVRVGSETRFACVDGPEFDAHLVDFALLSSRNAAYREFEACQVQEARHG